MSGSALLVVVERLEPSRIALRAVGVLAVILCVLALTYVLGGLLRAASGAPLLGWNAGLLEWATRFPLLATWIALIGTCGVSAVVLLLTWLPGRRVFSFDRANAYMTVGGKTTRLGLGEITVSGYPARLHVRGETFPIEGQDYERLAGFLRVVSHDRPRFKPIAAVKQTIIETTRPLRRAMHVTVRHPTHSA